MSFMTTEDDGGSGVDGGRFKVVTSTDASTWSAPATIAGPHAHWPGMLALSDTNFLTMYSLDGLGLVSVLVCQIVIWFANMKLGDTGISVVDLECSLCKICT